MFHEASILSERQRLRSLRHHRRNLPALALVPLPPLVVLVLTLALASCFGDLSAACAALPPPLSCASASVLLFSRPESSPGSGELPPLRPAHVTSTLIDGTTGRVYWQSEILPVPSVPLKELLPRFVPAWCRNHIRASLLSLALWYAVARNVVFPLFLSAASAVLSSEAVWGVALRGAPVAASTPWPLAAVYHILRYLHVLLSHVVSAVRWILSILPALRSTVFRIALFALYLIESTTCSTRRYLSNVLTPDGAAELIQHLISSPPVVTWTVRCFHYEWRRGMERVMDKDKRKTWKRHKVVTHTAKRKYLCDDKWTDASTVGVWDRGVRERGWMLGVGGVDGKKERHEGEDDAGTPSSFSPFSKLTLSKILVLSDEGALADYFRQQSEFVSVEGSRDVLAEFTTSINVDGFRPKVLVSRVIVGPAGTGIVRMHFFWIFTLMGLTVPYRMWFARHCDELSAVVTKNVYGTAQKPALTDVEAGAKKSLIPFRFGAGILNWDRGESDVKVEEQTVSKLLEADQKESEKSKPDQDRTEK